MADESGDIKSSLVRKSKFLASAGGGVAAVITLAFSYVDSKVTEVNDRIDSKVSETHSFVDSKHSGVEARLENIEKLLLKIDDRIYELSKNKGTRDE